MSDTSFLVALTVNSAHDLPKADVMLGKIDPYIRVLDNDRPVVYGCTSVKNREYNPVWNERISINDPSAKNLKFEVFDSDSLTDDDLVATAEISCEVVAAGPMKLALSLQDGYKSEGEPHLEICLHFISATVHFKEHKEGKMRADVCILEEDISANHLMRLVGVPAGTEYKLCYEEDVELEIPRGGLCQRKAKLCLADAAWLPDIALEVCEVKEVHKAPLNELVEKHGWTGCLTYADAKEMLRDCEFDDEHEHAYFVEKELGFAFKHDWDTKDCDIAAYSFQDAPDMIVDLKHATAKKRSHKFQNGAPKKVQGMQVAQAASIDDLPMPFMHCYVTVYVLHVVSKQIVPLTSVLPSKMIEGTPGASE